MSQTITKARVRHIKGVKDITLVFAPVTEITGPAGSGKSSFIDGLLIALLGKTAWRNRGFDKNPINLESEDAEVTVNTEKYEFRVKLRREGEGYRHEVTIADSNGGRYGSSKLGDLFEQRPDPTEFFSLPKEKIAEILQDFIPQDTRDRIRRLDGMIRDAEEERLLFSRRIAKMGEPTKMLPVDEPVSMTALYKLRDDIRDYNRDQERKQEAINAQEGVVSAAKRRVVGIEDQIRQLEAQKQEEEKRLRVAETVLKQLPQPKAAQSTDEVDEQIEAASDHIKAFDAWKAYQKVAEEYKSLKDGHRECDESIKEMRAQRESLLASAEMPIPNVSIVGTEIFIAGKPVDQLSTSEQYVFGTRLAVANSSNESEDKIKTLFIRHGEALDDPTFKKITEITQEAGYSLIVETARQGHSDEAIMIESGLVKEEQPKKTAPRKKTAVK